MPNMGSIIAQHNKQMLNRLSSADTKTPHCNCRNKRDCPLEGKCRTKCVIYKASVCTPNGKTMSYYSCCETDFKARYNNYKQSFKTSSKRHQTELSSLVWRLKAEGHNPVVKWSIVCNAEPYSIGVMHCQLCLAEKLTILWADPDTTLNKRSELEAKCRHSNKYKLIKIPPWQNPSLSWLVHDVTRCWCYLCFSRFLAIFCSVTAYCEVVVELRSF